MPFYDYKCEHCGDVFEKMHGIGETVESCPSCGGKVRKLFHPVGVIFKGSGFYKTDYRDASGNGGNGGGAEKQSVERIEKELEKAKETVSSAKSESKLKKDDAPTS